MGKLFGTDGIRAKAGQCPLDPDTLPLIGQAIGAHLGGPVLLAEDSRESSPWIGDLLRLGIEASGVDVEDAGILPTPGLALLTQQSDAAGGVMISASHNPFEYNGIKVFKADGRKLDDGEESAIESEVAAMERVVQSRPRTGERVIPSSISDWGEKYLDLLRARFADGPWLAGMRIRVDCANGANSLIAPALLESLGARVEPLHASPSGRNINAGCGAVDPRGLIESVRRDPCDLGAAYDGDGDRAMFVSPRGRLVDGDAVLLVMARSLKMKGCLNPAMVVGTSMTNYNLERQLNAEGMELIRVDVGDRYVFSRMLETGAPLGGEPSGHVIFGDFQLSGDGLLTTLKLCETLIGQGVSLDELTRDWKPAPQLLENLRVSERVPLESFPLVQEKIRDIRTGLEGRGRIVVRYSGTEPLLRIMIESDSAELNQAYSTDLIHCIQKSIGTTP